MNNIGRQSNSRPKSFNSTTGLFNISSSELKMSYQNHTPVWKRKCFLFPMLISCTVLGLLSFFAVMIYEQDKIHNLPERQFSEKTDKSIKNYSETSGAIQQRIKRFQTNLHEIHEQETLVTCKLNNGIKELNNQIKRLYVGLTRLDARVNRIKRGLNEQKAIADCVQMKDKLKNIYVELNRIFKTLSMMDENGICRCKCPLDITSITSTKLTHVTDIPFELTTFGSENTDDAQFISSNPTEKTKQLKKIVLSNYEPQNAVHNYMKITPRSIFTDKEIIVKTTDKGHDFTTSITITDTTTTTEENIKTTEIKEDMSPAMSNTVTNFVDFNNNNNAQTVEPRPFTTETPTSTTAESMDLNETTEITNLNYDGTTQKESLNKNLVSKLTTVNENVLEFNTETSVSKKYDHKTEVTRDFELTITNDSILKSTTEVSNSEKNYNNAYITEEFSYELINKSEDISEFTTELSVTKKYETNTGNINNTDITLKLTNENYNTKESSSTMSMSISDTNNVKGRTSLEVQGELKDEKQFNQSTMSNTNQYVWYPVCFYPVPCTQNASNHQKTIQNVSKNTILYSAQSLKTYKKKTPITDATIIQNSYPIISYCPVDMVCSKTDFVKEGNITMLHCMLQPTFYRSININTNTINTPYRHNYEYNKTKSSVTVESKLSRESDEILIGNVKCPLNTFPCVDNLGCVDTQNWCDGRIHCNDASDESQCNCKERIDRDKLCDGYYDCPSGEDELGCFGCNNETFSCGDWDIVSQRSSCFERKNRCDYINHCPNGRDEDECTLLSRDLENQNQIFFISYSSGYLHHNWKGNWYPVCDDDRIGTRAEKTCITESGEKSKPNSIQYIVNEPISYNGLYISIDGNNHISLLDSCKHQGVLVECEPEVCGIRSDLKFNKNIDPDRMKRNQYSEYSNNITSRYARSKDPRVVGGIASNPGAWPWLIALYQDGIFHCGGVILSDKWVLTAAHCVNQYQKHFYEVQAGILRRFSFSPMEQLRIVTHVIVHTQYSRSTMVNDLAVLRLEHGLEFNRWIRPVCLPDNKLNWIPYPGTICTAVGWGATVEHGPDPDNMREVEVPILAECTHKTDIDGGEICAGYLSGGHDTCQGDSGGPLLCREPNNLNKWYVAGIVSHGEGCARPMEPGVYTRVALYMEWIISVTEDDHLTDVLRPQQNCPGIRCKTGRHCIPTKRQCDKYVDCMNAEDEQNCDYTGSQYHVNLYRSINTDHSNLKYSQLKTAEEASTDVTAVTTKSPGLSSTVVFQNTKTTSPKPNFKTTLRQNEYLKVETSMVKVTSNKTNITLGQNDQLYNVFLKQLLDNQFTEKTFSCRRITQVVLLNYRCDGKVDCEDGTDEEACDCKTRLVNMYNSSAICDGVVDCHGGADETTCGVPMKCKSDEMICDKPNKCVKKSAWCDGIIDCHNDGSDEKYCTTITNGTTAVVTDAIGRLELRRSGMVAENRNGVWKVRCVDENTASIISHETCYKLNFMGSVYHTRKMAWNNPLPLNLSKLAIAADICQGVYVECGARVTVDTRLYHWHVNVVVDGKLERTGVLIHDSWVLVKRTAADLDLKKTYVIAVLGSGAYSSIWIKSPYEQVVRVDGIRQMSESDFDMLHLAVPATVTRGVTPLDIPMFQPTPGPHHTCYAIGWSDDRGDRTETARLRPDTTPCDDGHICFTVSQKPQSCSDGKNTSHVTAVVCESIIGLFLAAPVIQHTVNFCDSKTRIQLPEAENLINQIVDILDCEFIKPTPAPVCNGNRCKLGECVPWEKVCDGIPNCRDEEDEMIKMCKARTDKCKTNDTLCICDVGSFRCANGKCVEKTTFCNGINDCGDGTDEPKNCQKNTCVEYLKLTAPERLCDGRWDCLDKTDEEFTNCPGYCNKTNVYQCQSSNKCISSENVCDGEGDCPESDDEAECLGLIHPTRRNYAKNEGVLAIRSYGNWHAQCITEDYTNVNYQSLCKGLGFKYAVGIKKVTTAKVEFENFMIVQLNPKTDVAIRSATKNILQFSGHTCVAVYVVCSSS